MKVVRQKANEKSSKASEKSSKASEKLTEKAGEKSVGNENQGMIVTWDDVLCRPVYITPPPAATPASSSSSVSSTLDGAADEVVIGFQEKKDGKILDDRNNNGVKKEVGKSHGQRYYGSRSMQRAKGRVWDSNGDDVYSLNCSKRDAARLVDENEKMSQDLKMDEIDTSNKENIDPSFKGKHRLSALKNRSFNQALKPFCKKRKSMLVEKNTDNDDFEYNENDSRQRTRNDKPTCASSLSQPSSNTSLYDAKAYFDHLDANHALKISSSDLNASNQKEMNLNKSCMRRTLRPINYKCPKINKEYKDYCATSNDCNLTPLPLKQFVARRFKSAVPIGGSAKDIRICDGMLDEISVKND